MGNQDDDRDRKRTISWPGYSWLRLKPSGLGGRPIGRMLPTPRVPLAVTWGIGSRALSSAPLEIANVWIVELGGVMGGAAGH